MKKICWIILIGIVLYLLYLFNVYKALPSVNLNLSDTISKSEVLDTIPLLIQAIRFIESSNNDSLIGDGGKAHGPLQIHNCVLIDVNNVYNTNFSIRDCYDLTKSIEVFNLYQKIYNPMFDTIKALRIWNGGPKGYLKESTISYKDRVMSYLNKIK